MLVGGNEILWPAVDVREIAAPSAGDKDFLADALGALQHGNTPPAFAGLDRAEEPCGAGAKNHAIKSVDQRKLSPELRNVFCTITVARLSRLN